MKTSGMFSFFALAASAVATPMPQFTGFPGFPIGGGGGSGGSSSSTSNDVTNNVQPCRTYSVIFARGTSEGGNIGSVVGPQFKNALISKLGANGIAFQGVPYPANAAVSLTYQMECMDMALEANLWSSRRVTPTAEALALPS